MTHHDNDDPRGPHPDPPVDDNLEIAPDEINPGERPATEHPDPPVDAGAHDDEVDEASKESFPTSDPPASWAGPDDV